MQTVQTDPYPSRIETTPQWLPRQDPVVWSEGSREDAPLPAEQITFYEDNGYLMLPEFFDPGEVRALWQELDRLRGDETIRQGETTITEPGSGEVRSIFKIHQQNPVFGALAADDRLVEIAEYLLDDAVYLHQSRLNYKPGFRGKEFYWHSDFETWHIEDGMPRMRALSMSITLTDNSEFNGPLMLVPRSHRTFVACVGETPDDHYKRSLKQQEYGVPDDDSLRRLVDQGGLVAPKGKAGSVLIFECNTMHGSNSNISPFPRSNAFFVYNAVSNRLVAPFGAPRPRPHFIAERDNVVPLSTRRGQAARERRSA